MTRESERLNFFLFLFFLLITLQEAGYKLINAISWLIADVWAHNKRAGKA